jgi:uncharacterized protein (TIGR03067 family)
VKSLLLPLAFLSLSFAPAPFPKPTRPGDTTDDLKKIQGNWVRTDGNLPFRVTNDQLHFTTVGDSWKFTLDQKANPKRIDFVLLQTEKLTYRGIYRIEGDTWTYRVRMGD